jgi:phage/plasmid-like protein (TIGR03299 family)
MGHGIEVSDVFGEVRLNGKRAWHGLGIEIEPGLKTWPAFEKIGLNWETELLPVFATYKGEDGKVKQFKLPETMAHVRADNKQLLAVVSSGYRPISNKEAAEFADTLVEAEHGVTVETAGSLLNGKVIFTLVRLPHTIAVTDEDVLNNYVLLRNSHDCSTAFRAYVTSVRVVCANTLRLSEGDARHGISCQHTGNLQGKLEAARYALGLITNTTKRFEAQVRILAAKHLTVDGVKQYFDETYDATFGILPQVDETDEKSRRRYEHRLEKRDAMLARWAQNFESERQTLAGIRGTAWAAYNAVSQWHEHERGRFGTVQESDGRVHSNIFGVSDAGKQVAFQKALAIV